MNIMKGGSNERIERIVKFMRIMKGGSIERIENYESHDK